jgi:hypothetical protein
MIKSLTALAIFALLGASVIALPGFAPRLEARETIALAKGDRLDIRPVAGNCAQLVWPNFDGPFFLSQGVGCIGARSSFGDRASLEVAIDNVGFPS